MFFTSKTTGIYAPLLGLFPVAANFFLEKIVIHKLFSFTFALPLVIRTASYSLENKKPNVFSNCPAVASFSEGCVFVYQYFILGVCFCPKTPQHPPLIRPR